MEKEKIKFRYVLKHKPTTKIITFDAEMHEIENANGFWILVEKCTGIPASMQGNYELINRCRYLGIKDRKGVEICEKDSIEFADKWEWYRGSYGVKLLFANAEEKIVLKKQYEAEPMESRIIETPECYEWLLSSEIQTYWEVIGNIYETLNLKKNANSG